MGTNLELLEELARYSIKQKARPIYKVVEGLDSLKFSTNTFNQKTLAIADRAKHLWETRFINKEEVDELKEDVLLLAVELTKIMDKLASVQAVLDNDEVIEYIEEY